MRAFASSTKPASTTRAAGPSTKVKGHPSTGPSSKAVAGFKTKGEETHPPAKGEHGKGSTEHVPSPWWISFFALLLLSIAILPIVAEHWWESNRNKGIVAFILALPVFVYYLSVDWHPLVHEAQEYFSFIILLWALFTISGGIVLRGDLRATPAVNTGFLAIGAVLANIFGTTGSAMLLIRPLLKTNRERKRKRHIVIFFIFLVANIGGSLTPLGDPPLFLGYLRGVPFTWTLRLFPIWLFEVLLLLSIFFIWDTIEYKKEDPASLKWDESAVQPLKLDGKLNFLWIAGVLTATIFSKELHHFSEKVGFGWGEGSPWRELIMIAMGLLSLWTTPKKNREDNHFNFHPITEVAVLFAGIFVTMIPALAWLKANGQSLGVTKPWHFMWATGSLSSFLDNAPTYLVFFAAAGGLAAPMRDLNSTADVYWLATQHAHFISLLKAISIGAVFMGANTYIGNAPNFMVKVIADTSPGEMKVRMPTFFGYMLYSLMILIPTFILVTIIFFL